MAPGPNDEPDSKSVAVKAAETAADPPEKLRFLLIYGSETGQSQAVAEEIADKAAEHSLLADLHCMSTTDKAFHIEKETCVVIVVSSTGDGDPPDKAIKFWRKIKKRILPSDYLSTVHFALLGLGDSNYSNYCHNPKMFHKRLLELGAKTFYEPAWADDAVGLEETVQPWIEGLWPVLKKHLKSGPNNQSASDAIESDSCQNVEDNVTAASGSNSSSGPSTNNAILNNSVDAAQILRPGSEDLSLQSQEVVKEKDHTVKEESLIHSLPPLCDSAINVPALSPPFLKIDFHRDTQLDVKNLPIQNGCALPSSNSDLYRAAITRAVVMTRHDAVKKALKLELDITDCGWSYEPGDSFGVVCPNSEDEVQKLLERLDLSDFANVPYTLSIIEGTKKRNAAVPAHIPERGTLRHLFTTCCDIQSPPKKALLRAVVEAAHDENEKRRLQELCSRQGASHYTKYIREPSLSVLDVLIAFPSCLPPVQTLLEHLPRLAPRPYSAASCVSAYPGRLHFVFNIIEIPSGSGRHDNRRGVCTSWLDDITKDIQVQGCGQDQEFAVGSLSLESRLVPIYLRSNQHFRPPSNLSTPIIMVGPGTGVAPFIGFLQYRSQQLKDEGSITDVAPSWLFFGCRHQERDYLFREELEKFNSSGVLTKLCVSFSRDDDSPDAVKYVQHNICRHGADLADLITDKDALIYVCGDAKNMARDVTQAFVDILTQHKGMTSKNAMNYIMTMRLDKRYKEDVWT